MRYCYHAVLLPCGIVTIRYCYHAVLLPCGIVTIRYCYHTVLLLCGIVTMQYYYHAVLLPCPLFHPISPRLSFPSSLCFHTPHCILFHTIRYRLSHVYSCTGYSEGLLGACRVIPTATALCVKLTGQKTKTAA
jgi:hypothetical protein